MAGTPTQHKLTPWPALMPLGHHSGKPPIPLARPVTLIGSRQNAHLHLLSRQVSKAHALVLNSDNRIYIQDLASRTHVYVNGQEVTEAYLNEGDLLTIGTFTFRFTAGVASKRTPRNKPTPAGRLDLGGKPLKLKRRVLLIGRRPASDLPLLENSVSTAHAVIFDMNGRRFIRDLGSRTGTFVNGAATRQMEIRFGDTLRIGRQSMKYTRDPDATPAPKAAATYVPPEPVLDVEDVDIAMGPAVSGAAHDEPGIAIRPDSPADAEADALHARESDHGAKPIELELLDSDRIEVVQEAPPAPRTPAPVSPKPQAPRQPVISAPPLPAIKPAAPSTGNLKASPMGAAPAKGPANVPPAAAPAALAGSTPAAPGAPSPGGTLKPIRGAEPPAGKLPSLRPKQTVIAPPPVAPAYVPPKPLPIAPKPTVADADHEIDLAADPDIVGPNPDDTAALPAELGGPRIGNIRLGSNAGGADDQRMLVDGDIFKEKLSNSGTFGDLNLAAGAGGDLEGPHLDPLAVSEDMAMDALAAESPLASGDVPDFGPGTWRRALDKDPQSALPGKVQAPRPPAGAKPPTAAEAPFDPENPFDEPTQNATPADGGPVTGTVDDIDALSIIDTAPAPQVSFDRQGGKADFEFGESSARGESATHHDPSAHDDLDALLDEVLEPEAHAEPAPPELRLDPADVGPMSGLNFQVGAIEAPHTDIEFAEEPQAEPSAPAVGLTPSGPAHLSGLLDDLPDAFDEAGLSAVDQAPAHEEALLDEAEPAIAQPKESPLAAMETAPDAEAPDAMLPEAMAPIPVDLGDEGADEAAAALAALAAQEPAAVEFDDGMIEEAPASAESPPVESVDDAQNLAEIDVAPLAAATLPVNVSTSDDAPISIEPDAVEVSPEASPGAEAFNELDEILLDEDDDFVHDAGDLSDTGVGRELDAFSSSVSGEIVEQTTLREEASPGSREQVAKTRVGPTRQGAAPADAPAAASAPPAPKTATHVPQAPPAEALDATASEESAQYTVTEIPPPAEAEVSAEEWDAAPAAAADDTFATVPAGREGAEDGLPAASPDEMTTADLGIDEPVEADLSDEALAEFLANPDSDHGPEDELTAFLNDSPPIGGEGKDVDTIVARAVKSAEVGHLPPGVDPLNVIEVPADSLDALNSAIDGIAVKPSPDDLLSDEGIPSDNITFGRLDSAEAAEAGAAGLLAHDADEAVDEPSADAPEAADSAQIEAPHAAGEAALEVDAGAADAHDDGAAFALPGADEDDADAAVEEPIGLLPLNAPADISGVDDARAPVEFSAVEKGEPGESAAGDAKEIDLAGGDETPSLPPATAIAATASMPPATAHKPASLDDELDAFLEIEGESAAADNISIAATGSAGGEIGEVEMGLEGLDLLDEDVDEAQHGEEAPTDEPAAPSGPIHVTPGDAGSIGSVLTPMSMASAVTTTFQPVGIEIMGEAADESAHLDEIEVEASPTQLGESSHSQAPIAPGIQGLSDGGDSARRPRAGDAGTSGGPAAAPAVPQSLAGMGSARPATNFTTDQGSFLGGLGGAATLRRPRPAPISGLLSGGDFTAQDPQRPRARGGAGAPAAPRPVREADAFAFASPTEDDALASPFGADDALGAAVAANAPSARGRAAPANGPLRPARAPVQPRPAPAAAPAAPVEADEPMLGDDTQVIAAPPGANADSTMTASPFAPRRRMEGAPPVRTVEAAPAAPRRRVHTGRLIVVSVIALLCAAGAFAALFFTQKPKSDISAEVVLKPLLDKTSPYSSLAPNNSEAMRSIYTLMKDLMQQVGVRGNAMKLLASRSPDVPADFLYDDAAFRTRVEIRFLAPRGDWEPAAVEFTIHGTQMSADAARAQALIDTMINMPAIQQEMKMANEAQVQLREIEAQIRTVDAELARINQDAATRPADPAGSLPALQKRRDQLDADYKQRLAERVGIEQSLERLRVSAAQSSSLEGVPSTDDRLKELTLSLAAAKDAYDKARAESSTQLESKRKALDDAVAQFQDSLKNQDMTRASPQLADLLTEIRGFVDAVREISSDVLQRDQDWLSSLTEIRAARQQALDDRRLARQSGDAQLKELATQLGKEERGLFAAKDSNLPAEQVAKQQQVVDELEQKVKARKLELGEDPQDTKFMADLSQKVDVAQHRLEDDKKKADQRLQDLNHTLALKAEALTKLPEGPHVVADMKQRVDAMNQARQVYNEALQTQSSTRVEQLKARFEEAQQAVAQRRKELADAGVALTPDQAAQIQVLRRQLEDARAAEDRASRAYAEVETQIAQVKAQTSGHAAVDAAPDRQADLATKLLNLKRDRDVKSELVARGVNVQGPLASDFKSIRQEDVRMVHGLLGAVGMLVLFGLFVAFSPVVIDRRTGRPTRNYAAPANAGSAFPALPVPPRAPAGRPAARPRAGGAASRGGAFGASPVEQDVEDDEPAPPAF